MSKPEVSILSSITAVWSEDTKAKECVLDTNGYQTPPQEGMGFIPGSIPDTPESPPPESFDSFFARTSDEIREESGEPKLPVEKAFHDENAAIYLGKCYPRYSQITRKQHWKAIITAAKPEHGEIKLMSMFRACVKKVEYDLEEPTSSRLFREIIRNVLSVPISREIGKWIDTIVINLPLIEPNTQICQLASIFKERQRQGYSNGIDHESEAIPDSSLNLSFAAHHAVHHDAFSKDDRVSRVRSIPTETITVRAGSQVYHMPLAALLENPYFPWIYRDNVLDDICMTEHHPQVYLSKGDQYPNNNIMNLIGDFNGHFKCLEWFCRFIELTFLYIKHPFVVRRNTIRKKLYLDTSSMRFGREQRSHNAALFDLFDLFKSKELKTLFCDIYYLPKLRSARQMCIRKEPKRSDRSYEFSSSIDELKYLVSDVELCCKGYYTTRFASATQDTFCPHIPEHDFPSALFVASAPVSGPYTLAKLQNCILCRIDAAKCANVHQYRKYGFTNTEDDDDNISNSAVLGHGDN